MGCDIHAFIEYRDKEDKREEAYWEAFSGELSLGRNYYMFGYLTNGNVRYGGVNLKFGVDPKGLPKDPSYEIKNNSRLWITEKGEGDNETTLEKAEKWNKSLGCKIHYDHWNDKSKPSHVDHPDLHSHSWLSLKEYKMILDAAIKDQKKHHEWVNIQYKVIYDLMKSLDKNGMEVRLVFWFDN